MPRSAHQVDGGEAYGGGASAAPSAAAAPDGEPTSPDQVGNLVDDAKIVRTGSMELEVGDVPAALLAARDGIRAMGGYIGASETQTLDDRPVATITYRIPVDRWEDALDLLRGIAGDAKNVLNERTQAVEVTGAVVDLEARIRNLRSSEIALQDISAKAARVSDVLEVQAQLTAVRGQIEQLTAQLTQLNDQASYATLDVTFSTPVVAVQVAAEGWQPAVVVDEATASLVEILQSLTTAGHLVRDRVAAGPVADRRRRARGRDDPAPARRDPARGTSGRRAGRRDSTARSVVARWGP